MGFAHRLKPPVVHRDLKPANVLVKPRPGGKWGLRITDFGIGGLAIQQAVAQSRRASKHGEFLTAAVRGSYTPLYGSPQQMRGEDPDPRDDVYALGVIWHQLLTGDLTTGRPGGEAWKKRLTERGMTPALLALLASCFEDRREDRPDNGVDLAEKLSRALAQPAPTSDPSPIPIAIPLPDVLPAEGPPNIPPRLGGTSASAEGKIGQTRRRRTEDQAAKRPERVAVAKTRCPAAGGVLALAVLLLGDWFAQKWFAGNSPVEWHPGNIPETTNSPSRSPSTYRTTTNSIGMKLKLIPAGTFTMGSPEGERYHGCTRGRSTRSRSRNRFRWASIR